MHQQLLRLPDEILASPHTAIIIPPIFFNSALMAPRCRSLASCIELCVSPRRFTPSSRKEAPKTKQEVVRCVKEKRCLISKEGGHAHVGPSSR